MNPQVQEFDRFFVDNYNYLLTFTKSIDPKNDYGSLLHTVYIRCRERIEKAGFSNTGYLNYTRCSLMNHYKTEFKKQKQKTNVNIDDPIYYQTIETTLQDQDYVDQQEKRVEGELSYIIAGLYEYLDKYYDSKHVFVFKTYYLLKHKHLNYKQLSDATGYSITAVSLIIKKIKKDLRKNLITFLKTGKNMTELQEEVKTLLS